MERKLVKIGEAASLIGSTPATLRKWEETGELLPAHKTKGGTRSKTHRKLLHDLQASADVMAEDLGIYDAARPQD